jgi:hypothetical protein
MSLIRKDSKFDLNQEKGPQFDRLLKNSFLKDLFEEGKQYFSSIHKVFYGPQGKGPETKRGPKTPRKYVDNLPR